MSPLQQEVLLQMRLRGFADSTFEAYIQPGRPRASTHSSRSATNNTTDKGEEREVLKC
jgi:hypothetical protein